MHVVQWRLIEHASERVCPEWSPPVEELVEVGVVVETGVAVLAEEIVR
jgi:hypothetical protein